MPLSRPLGRLLPRPDQVSPAVIPMLTLLLSRLGLCLVGVAALSHAPIQPGGWHASEHLWLDIWARWDSGYYLEIARHGYSFAPGEMSSVAFLPLYPLLMRLLALGSESVEVLTAVGWLISNAATVLAFWLLWRMICAQEGPLVARRTLAFLALFPTSFYLSVVYTEGLFLLLTVAAFYCARRGRWWAAGLLGAAGGATRVIGTLIVLPLALEWHAQRDRSWRDLAWLALVPLGLLSYMAYLYARWGDPLLFQRAQEAWGRSASGVGAMGRLADLLAGGDPLARLWSALAAAPLDFAAIGLGLLLLVALLRQQPLSHVLYAAYSLAVPLATLLTTSMPRYLIVIFPFFLALGRRITRPWLCALVLALSYALQLWLFARWCLWYWVA